MSREDSAEAEGSLLSTQCGVMTETWETAIEAFNETSNAVSVSATPSLDPSAPSVVNKNSHASEVPTKGLIINRKRKSDLEDGHEEVSGAPKRSRQTQLQASPESQAQTSPDIPTRQEVTSRNGGTPMTEREHEHSSKVLPSIPFAPDTSEPGKFSMEVVATDPVGNCTTSHDDSDNSSSLSSVPASPDPGEGRSLDANKMAFALVIDANAIAARKAPTFQSHSTPLNSRDNVNRNSQRGMSSFSTSSSAESVKMSVRTRIKPEFYGDPVPTASVIKPSVKKACDHMSGRHEIQSVGFSAEREKEPVDVIKKTPRPRSNGVPSSSRKKHMSNPKTIDTESSKTLDTRSRNAKAKSILSSPEPYMKVSLGTWLLATRKTLMKDIPQLTSLRKTQRAITSKIASSKPVQTIPRSFAVIPGLPEPDPDKLALSRKLTWRDSLKVKPNTQGEPDVWAESRQALCETLPYFKSPQSGCYQNDGHVYGFLFDSIGHCREYMDENVIICRAGGGMESDGDGGMVQRRDHSLQEPQVQAVLNDIEHQNPVVVICGNRNAAARCKMPHQYSVLGWYKPTLVWSEKTAGKGDRMLTTVKYRLERLNRHKPAWHAPKESEISEDDRLTEEDRVIAGTLAIKECGQCLKEYPQAYLRAWMCLNADCSRFWKFDGVLEPPRELDVLEYNPAFLLDKADAWSDGSEESEPAPLRPPIPDVGNAIGDNLTYINTRGICCPECGRCNSRRFFKGWICENAECKFELPVIHHSVVPAMLHTPWDAAPTLVRNRHDRKVHLKVEHKYGYKVSTYTFSGIDGCFVHAAATKQLVQEKYGPNDMFESMQIEDMGLERRTFAAKIATGEVDKHLSEDTELAAEQSAVVDRSEESIVAEVEAQEKKMNFADGDLMTAFSMNYGMPYKFVASGASRPFEQGPWPVAETRRRLNWAAKKLLNKPESDMDFNEELVLAYLEGQKIEYHDDGEDGLGPCIASLSLGGRAKMHMRMKTKHHIGCSKTGIFTEERPVPGGLVYEKRLEKWQELETVRGDSVIYNQRRKEIPKELGIFEKRTKKAEDLVTITLSHGDIVIMDGYGIQKYLEHKVVPEGYLRFALTCRTVLGNHLKPKERPNYDVKRDEQIYDGPKI